MFDPVTDEALRLRRRGAPAPTMDQESSHKTSLVCHVCSREIRPEEELFWVDNVPHCFQCHDMLAFELEKERGLDSDMKDKGTRWEKDPED